VEPIDDDFEDLYENAPCGYLSTAPDGTIIQVNQTFLGWTGHDRPQLVGKARLQDLLAPGDRIFYETHIAPLLRMQEQVREIAVTVVAPLGRLPMLLNATLVRGTDAAAQMVRACMFLAADRRSYEVELLAERRRAEESEARARQLATTLQQSLIPPTLPMIDGLDLAAVYRPAGRGDEIGGDFYDVFQTGRDEWALVIGDVAGKGAGAAVLTSLIRYTLRATATRTRSPRTVLSALNSAIRAQGSGRACTVAFARIRPGTQGRRRLTLALAGHPPPLLLTPNGRPVAIGRFGTMLGVLDTPELHETTIDLHPGDVVVLYTDGVTEGRRGTEYFGEDRLTGVLAQLRGRTAAEIAARLGDVAVDYQGGLPRDDIAVVVLAAGHLSNTGSDRALV
jgi:sigma-B regulation protein RsbU (phosphoserine phosphatase)